MSRLSVATSYGLDMDDVIDIRGLHKSFGTTHALDGLDLTVATGAVAGVALVLSVAGQLSFRRRDVITT